MKKVLTFRSVLLNSLIVIIFAACGANAQKKAENCSSVDSEILIPKNNFTESLMENEPHPMVLPQNSDYEQESHPMVISSCRETK